MLFRTFVLRAVTQRRACWAREQSDPIFTRQGFSHCTFCLQNTWEYSTISSGVKTLLLETGEGRSEIVHRRAEILPRNCTLAVTRVWGIPVHGMGLGGPRVFTATEHSGNISGAFRNPRACFQGNPSGPGFQAGQGVLLPLGLLPERSQPCFFITYFRNLFCYLQASQVVRRLLLSRWGLGSSTAGE